MGKVNYTTEQIIVKLREVEVLCSQGRTIGEAVHQSGVTSEPIIVGDANTVR
ncbi:MAG: hypothetical protein GX488_07265 [Clostridiales bacterium]|nr:hypothetical protein [Clostridiales bacterium]